VEKAFGLSSKRWWLSCRFGRAKKIANSNTSMGAKDRSNDYFFLGSLRVWKAVRLDSITQHSPATHKDSIKKDEKVTTAMRSGQIAGYTLCRKKSGEGKYAIHPISF
jgi:hypothetical protein